MEPGVPEEKIYEIEIMDFLRVGWRWKYFLVFFMILAGVASYVAMENMPKKYKTSMAIKPAYLKILRVSVEDNFFVIGPGGLVPQTIDDKHRVVKIGQLEALIELGLFDNKIKKELGITNIKLDAVIEPRFDMLKVMCTTIEPDTGVKFLDALYEDINEYYQEGVTDYLEEIDRNIKVIQFRIAQDRKYLETLNQKKANLDRLVLKIENNLDISQDRHFSEEFIIAQERALVEYKNMLLDIETRMNQINMASLIYHKDKLEKTRRDYKAIILVAPPVKPSLHEKKYNKVIIVSGAIFGSLFFGVILIFFLDYIINYFRGKD